MTTAPASTTRPARRGTPEHAVRARPENTAASLTPAEADARRHLRDIAEAEAAARAELAAKARED